MPEVWLVIKYAAQNQSRNEALVPWSTDPAVTDT